MLTADQLSELRRLEAEHEQNATRESRDLLSWTLWLYSSDLLRAAEVVAACERWGAVAFRGGWSHWVVSFRKTEQQVEWNRTKNDHPIEYYTFSDAVLAAAKWLQEREGK